MLLYKYLFTMSMWVAFSDTGHVRYILDLSQDMRKVDSNEKILAIPSLLIADLLANSRRV